MGRKKQEPTYIKSIRVKIKNDPKVQIFNKNRCGSFWVAQEIPSSEEGQNL